MNPASTDIAASQHPSELPVRTLDAATLKALSHPLRVKLWDRLVMSGPATSTMLARETGESTGATSYHLRQLASHGLIEEASDLGKGRERWWRVVPGSVRVDSRMAASPAEREVLGAFTRQWQGLREDAARRFHERVADGTEPAEWVEAAEDSVCPLYLTVDELTELSRQLGDVIRTFADSHLATDSAPQDGQRLVELAVRAFPAAPPD